VFRRGFFRHPCGNGERLRFGRRLIDRVQDEASLIVHHMPTYDAEPFACTRMKAVSNNDFSMQSLVGSMLDLVQGPQTESEDQDVLGNQRYAVQTQIWTALIAMLVLKYLQLKSTFVWSLSNLAALLRHQLFVYRELYAWLNKPFEAPPALEAIHDAQLVLELGI
jgi:hypothetical protein